MRHFLPNNFVRKLIQVGKRWYAFDASARVNIGTHTVTNTNLSSGDVLRREVGSIVFLSFPLSVRLTYFFYTLSLIAFLLFVHFSLSLPPLFDFRAIETFAGEDEQEEFSGHRNFFFSFHVNTI